MKIHVFIKSVPDTTIPLEFVADSGRLKNDWNVPILNPDDSAAVTAALKIKSEAAEAQITVIHLGPPSGERFLREAIALGCDRCVRVWDEGLEDLHAGSKAMIFARVSEILGFDLLLTGAKSRDTGSAQLGVLLASTLQIPFITRACSVDAVGKETIVVTRMLERGYRQRVQSSMPLVMALEGDEESLSCASFPDLARAAEIPIPCFDLPETGIARAQIRDVESLLTFGPVRPPEPRLQFIQPPDSTLPAFERRRQIGEGSMERRKGRIVKGNKDAVVEELFQALLHHGFLDHLKIQESEEA